MGPSRTPAWLDAALAELAVSTVRAVENSFRPTALQAVGWSDAPKLQPHGRPPYDAQGHYDLIRYPNFMSSLICVRLDLSLVPDEYATRVVQGWPEHIGEDGALYVYEDSMRSQFQNRLEAARKVRAMFEQILASEAAT